MVAEQHVSIINIINGGQKRCRGNGRSPRNSLSKGKLRDAIKNLQNKKYRETLSKSIIQYFKVKGFRKSYNYCKREKEEIGIVNELNFLLLPLVKMRFNCDKTKN